MGKSRGASFKPSLKSRWGAFGKRTEAQSSSASMSSIAGRLSASELYASETRAMASEFEYSDFEGWMCTGGDDRSLILETGANKYHIRPQPIDKSAIFRGSCTGNPPTLNGYEAAKELFEAKLKGLDGGDLDTALRDVFEEQRSRLAKYLNLPAGAEVILCPSGSDAEYLPIAIAKALQPDKDIVNGVTQLNEIGAGSEPASTGKFFSKYAPFLGDHGLEHLEGFERVGGVVVSARDKDGNINNASEEMAHFSEKYLGMNSYPIVHGVFGGKTGVRDEIMPGSLDGGDRSLGVIDACQGRFTLEELSQWLEQDSIVLFTSSKFYQAPPFCGAIILPKLIASKLKKAAPPSSMLIDKGLGAFVSDKELPACLDSWKPYLIDKRKNNVGLALRWEAGLSAMEALSEIPDVEKVSMIKSWADTVENMVESNEMLDTFCVERSIVSIRMKKNGGGCLNMSEARDLFRWMSLDVSSALPEASEEEKKSLSTLAFTGQPVSVSESYAIVRIALGSDSLLSYAKDEVKTLEEDQMTVTKIGLIAKYFNTLKSSGF